MNVKRYLKKQAEKDRQKILNADNGAFLRELEQMVVEKPKKRPRLRVWLPATLSAVASAAVVVTCIVVYYPSESEHIEYLDANLIYSDSDLDELNKDVKEFDLQIDSTIYSYTVKKTSDLISGDVLFYATKISDTNSLVDLEIVTVCNPNYKYKDFQISDNAISAQLANYTVMYETTLKTNAEYGIDTLTAIAEIHKGDEYIYITNYSEMLLSPEGSFLEILQSIVK